MAIWDYVVLVGYFAVMAGIGLWTMMKIKRQEDYFIGGRGFGKLFQTFAAFGAGTGSGDPVAVAEKTFVSGMSGIWSMFSWLFATPFYWITGVWYRRMRSVTLGDWYVERYQSPGIGAVYTVFSLAFYIFYSAFLFSAVGQFTTPLMGETLFGITTANVVIPAIAAIVIFYGMLGGLIAAYWTDLIQGICIILLSILLIPFGLDALVESFGDPATQSMFDGFRIMHERLPESMFTIVGSSNTSEFPVYRIAAFAALCLFSIISQPHMIAAGGGSAKKEIDARIGLVTGNFFKRFCTVGWALTALIILALMAGDIRLQEHPEQAWGFASMELFKNYPGLTGLMLACLLAALMSSVSCYMVVCSGLLIQNVYKPYFKPNATESEGLLAGRLAGLIIVVGAVIVAIMVPNVFALFKYALTITIPLSAILLIGLYWRRATKWAAWATLIIAGGAFFVCPWLLPWVQPQMYDTPAFTSYTSGIVTFTTKEAAAVDVEQRQARIEAWDKKKDALIQSELGKTLTPEEIEEAIGPRPEPLELGQTFTSSFPAPSNVELRSIFWSGGLEPVVTEGEVAPIPEMIEESNVGAGIVEQTYRFPADSVLRGRGNFKPEMLVYHWISLNLESYTPAMLETLSVFPQILLPVLVMILISLITPGCSRELLDRYYVKMKTPVEPNIEDDKRELELSYAQPNRYDNKRLLPGTGLEIQKPTVADLIGFIVSFGICFGIIALAAWVAQIQ